jgi:hypothetical protein
MLVACRLTGLSALETHCAGVRARAQCGPRLACSPRPDLFRATKTAENRRDVGRADPKTPGLNSTPYWPGGASHDVGRTRVAVRRSVQAVSGFVTRQ